MSKELTWAEYVEWGPKLPNGAFLEYDMEAIYPAISRLGKDSVYLEVGVRHGRSLAWARQWSKGDVYGVDINNELIEHPMLDKINFIHAPSNEAVKNWTLPIDVLFIDGDHTYEGVKDDWDNFSPFIKPGGVVYFHDCDATSPGVVQLFEEIGKGWKNKTLWTEKMDFRKTSMASVEKA
jgi:hypothetical protein